MNLIDVDKLFKTLNKLEIPFYADINNAINSQPTAYNVDKVIEQLEEARQFIAKNDYCKQINSNEDCNDRDCFLCCADYLIDIVKRGGIDE